MKNLVIIKEGVKRFWKNPVLALPVLFQDLIGFSFVVIALLIAAAIIGTSLLPLLFSKDAEAALSALPVLMDNIGIMALIIAVLVIITVIISSFFESCLLAMIKKENIKFKDFFEGRKFFSRILIYNLLFGLLLLVFLAIMGYLLVIFVKMNSLALVALGILMLIVFILLILLFLFTPYYIVGEDLAILDAIKKSIKVARKNYLKLLGLLTILILISIAVSIVLGFIPFIGSILSSILVGTYQRLCLYMLALSKKE